MPDEPLCRICGKKKTISPTTIICPSCMAKKAVKKRMENRKKAGLKKTGAGKAVEKKIPNNPIVSIDFTRHPDVLRNLKRAADEETRPPEFQALHILKVYFAGREGGTGV